MFFTICVCVCVYIYIYIYIYIYTHIHTEYLFKSIGTKTIFTKTVLDKTVIFSKTVPLSFNTFIPASFLIVQEPLKLLF